MLAENRKVKIKGSKLLYKPKRTVKAGVQHADISAFPDFFACADFPAYRIGISITMRTAR